MPTPIGDGIYITPWWLRLIGRKPFRRITYWISHGGDYTEVKYLTFSEALTAAQEQT